MTAHEMTMSEQTISIPDTTPSLPPEYETKQQLATRINVSVRTIDNLLTRGLPYVRLTRKLIRFPRAAVDAWLLERQVRR
jgi:excisionase family DNA binding protein